MQRIKCVNSGTFLTYTRTICHQSQYYCENTSGRSLANSISLLFRACVLIGQDAITIEKTKHKQTSIF